MEALSMPLLTKSGEAIKINCPPLGDWPERELLLCYDKENFIFDIYDNYKKVGTIGEKQALSNIENGLYVIVQPKVNPPYKAAKCEINYWVKETMDYWNVTTPENRPPKLKQLQENLKTMEAQLAQKNNDDFYADFPFGDCARELKVKYEATKIVLRKIEKQTVTQ